MNITVNLSEEEFEILEERATKSNVGISEYVRRAMLEKLEDDEDLEAAETAYREYLKDGEVISHKEFWQGLEV